MSDEHIRLIAKLQHFYDSLEQKREEFDTESIKSRNGENVIHHQRSEVLSSVIFEFTKVFDNFLYKD